MPPTSIVSIPTNVSSRLMSPKPRKIIREANYFGGNNGGRGALGQLLLFLSPPPPLALIRLFVTAVAGDCLGDLDHSSSFLFLLCRP